MAMLLTFCNFLKELSYPYHPLHSQSALHIHWFPAHPAQTVCGVCAIFAALKMC